MFLFHLHYPRFIILTFIFSFLIINPLHAQDTNADVQVKSIVEEAQKNLAKANSRKFRRKKKKQLKYLKAALKSFSDAHRMIIGLELEDSALKQAVQEGFEQAHSKKVVQKEMKKLAKKLTQALAKKDCKESYQHIEKLYNLDARSKSYDYLSTVILKLCPPTSP